MDSSILVNWTSPFFHLRGYLVCLSLIEVTYANSVDTDQTFCGVWSGSTLFSKVLFTERWVRMVHGKPHRLLKCLIHHKVLNLDQMRDFSPWNSTATLKCKRSKLFLACYASFSCSCLIKQTKTSSGHIIITESENDRVKCFHGVLKLRGITRY